MQNCRDEIIKLAGEDYTILEGAQKHLCEQADELLEAFKQFEEKMKKVTTGIEENEEETEPFIVETSQETELCNQD